MLVLHPSTRNSTGSAPLLSGLRRVLGRWRRRGRALRDGTLHAGRRRRALDGLAARPSPGRILFLCLGNVCRSPYAAHRFRRDVADLPPPLPEAVSGGLIGPGRTPTDLALETALARGVDTSAHRSQVVTRELLDSCDLLVLVDTRHLRRLRRSVGPITTAVVHLGDLDPEPVRSRTIRDPWGQELRVYDDVFDRLDRCLAVLAEAVLAEAVTERSP